MKIKNIMWTMLLLTSICYGQIENIELPKGGVDVFDVKNKHYTVHISSNEEFYFNKKRVLFWDQISTEILKEIRTPNFNAVQNIAIYADKSVDYYMITRLRMEIGKVWSGYIHLMGNTEKEQNCLTYYLQGSHLSQKEYDETNWIYGHDVIFTKKQKSSEEKYDRLKYKGEIEEWPIFAVWQSQFLPVFYSGKVNDIKQYLSQAKFKGIKAYSKDSFQIEQEQVYIKEEGKLKELCLTNDILFVYMSYIRSYESCYGLMSAIQQKRYRQANHGALRKPLIVVLSGEYKTELEEKGLNLFDRP